MIDIYWMPYRIWDHLADRAPVDKNGFAQGWLVEGYIESEYGLTYNGNAQKSDSNEDLHEYIVSDPEKFKNYIMFIMKNNFTIAKNEN